MASSKIKMFSINATSTSLSALRNILENKSTKITIATAEKSSVSSVKPLSELERSLPKDQRTKFKQIVLNGEDHNSCIVHLMPRAVA